MNKAYSEEKGNFRFEVYEAVEVGPTTMKHAEIYVGTSPKYNITKAEFIDPLSNKERRWIKYADDFFFIAGKVNA
jgi:hypothetical protein